MGLELGAPAEPVLGFGAGKKLILRSLRDRLRTSTMNFCCSSLLGLFLRRASDL